MKTTAMHHRKVNTRSNIPYPNAATKKELMHKMLDMLLSAAYGAAFATIILFFLAVA